MPLEGQMKGIGDPGWNEDFDQAWAQRMMKIYGVSMDDLRDPNTRRSLNRQQREKAAAAPGATPPAVPPSTGAGAVTNPISFPNPTQPQWVTGQSGPKTGGPEPLPPQTGTSLTGPPRGNVFRDPNRRRTATSAFTLQRPPGTGGVDPYRS